MIVTGKLNILGGIGGNQGLDSFGERLKLGGKDSFGLSLPIKINSFKIVGNIGQNLRSNGSVKREKVIYFFDRISS